MGVCPSIPPLRLVEVSVEGEVCASIVLPGIDQGPEQSYSKRLSRLQLRVND